MYSDRLSTGTEVQHSDSSEVQVQAIFMAQSVHYLCMADPGFLHCQSSRQDRASHLCCAQCTYMRTVGMHGKGSIKSSSLVLPASSLQGNQGEIRVRISVIFNSFLMDFMY